MSSGMIHPVPSHEIIGDMQGSQWFKQTP